MASSWFGPPNGHQMRQQPPPPPPPSQPQPGGNHYHSSGIPPPGGSVMNGGGGATSPHGFNHRHSPPMRGQYPSHGHAAGPRNHALPPHSGGHPHGGPRMPPQGGHFQVQHPQTMAVNGHRPTPPTGAGHSHISRHHAPSPGISRRMPLPPPNAMRPIPQQAGGGSRPPYEHGASIQHQQQGLHPRPMHHQQMMRFQQEHQHQQQDHHRHQHHFSHVHPNSTLSEYQYDMTRDVHTETYEKRMHQHPHFQAPGTPERQPSSVTHSRSPSPPPIPPPPSLKLTEVPQRPSPASIAESEGSRSTPPQMPSSNNSISAWNPGPGMGPLRESRLQNMPPKHLMMPMAQHPHHPHAQRPIPWHRSGGMHHHPYVNENMERYRAMEQQQRIAVHHMKPIHHQHAQHPSHLGGPMGSRPGGPSPGHQQIVDQQHKQEAIKKGPDITMDAASMLLALRTSASPSTVSAATLEEQASRDQSETSKKMAVADQQDHDDDLEDDDVPALSSSSSSLSVPPPKAQIHHHEVPKNFPTRLALPSDEAKLNSLHCFLRSELLEIFVVERSANKSPTHSPGSSVGRVGLRCVFCAMVRKRSAVSTTSADNDTSSTSQQQRVDEAPMAVFYPKSIAEIYRLVTSWQRCHLRKCRNLPPDIRSKWTLLRENDKSRGKTHYWITSAKEIGLVDCQSRAGGIRFGSPMSSIEASDDSITNAGESDVKSLFNQSNNENIVLNAAQPYQPRSNPNFLEGPSQKQREAISRVESSAPISTVESPLKIDHHETKPSIEDLRTGIVELLASDRSNVGQREGRGWSEASLHPQDKSDSHSMQVDASNQVASV